MAIKLEINMTNKWLYSLIAVGIVLALGVGVYAYQSNMRAGNPSIMGHSAGEIHVEVRGQIKTLQEVIDLGNLGANLRCVTVRAYENTSYFVVDTFGISGITAQEVVDFVPNQNYPVWPRLIGITAKNGWAITGCAHASGEDGYDIDFFMFNNGCFFDANDGSKDMNLIDARFCRID